MDEKDKAIENAAKAFEVLDDTIWHLYSTIGMGAPLTARLENARRLLEGAKLLRDKQQKGGGHGCD